MKKTILTLVTLIAPIGAFANTITPDIAKLPLSQLTRGSEIILGSNITFPAGKTTVEFNYVVITGNSTASDPMDEYGWIDTKSFDIKQCDVHALKSDISPSAPSTLAAGTHIEVVAAEPTANQKTIIYGHTKKTDIGLYIICGRVAEVHSNPQGVWRLDSSRPSAASINDLLDAFTKSNLETSNDIDLIMQPRALGQTGQIDTHLYKLSVQ